MNNCPVCGHNDFEFVYELNDYRISQETFSLSKCLNCTLISTLAPPKSSDISKYYLSDDYLEHSNRKTDLFSIAYIKAREIMFGYKYRIIKKFITNGEILDIGAGSGHYLNFMSKKGFKCTGIEMSGRARAFAKDTFDIDIYPDDHFYNSTFVQKYDLISLWHVLEHLYDLEKVVKRIDDLLKPKGHLIIAVPNYNGFEQVVYKKYWSGWDVPRHLWHFSPKSMKQLLAKNNFVVTEMKMMPFDPFFNTLLSNKYRNGHPIINVFRMILVGGMAFFQGFFNVEKTSSIIYIIKRKEIN